jgi:hypothetical protein
VYSPLIIRGGGYWFHSTEIIESPHEGTAVLRTDGSIYSSPRPGFTGGDSMKVQRAACNYSGTWHVNSFHDWCGHLIGAYAIFANDILRTVYGNDWHRSHPRNLRVGPTLVASGLSERPASHCHDIAGEDRHVTI